MDLKDMVKNASAQTGWPSSASGMARDLQDLAAAKDKHFRC